MKVLRLHGVGDLRLHDEPEPVPGPGDALLRVTAVGLCGSDLHWFSEAGIPLPNSLTDADGVMLEPLEEFDKAFSAAQRREGLKVIIEP